LLLISPNLYADETPEKKWELGVGLGSVYGPDYRGSDEYRSFTSVIPYVVYHGKFIRSDREGIKAQFFSSDDIDFSLSASAYISPNSDENERRENMPSLGSTIELGPSLNIRLTGENLRNGWQLQLPLRAVFAVGGSSDKMIGSVIQPQLVYQHTFSSWNLRYRTSVMFGSKDYHDYYYTVEAQYATAARAEFNSIGGYSGFINDISLSRELKIEELKTRFAFFIRYDNLANVKFNESPLFVSENVWRGGAAIIWIIK
jgi:outer membrane scaffolding protein for murein synthesis (MipA/OmpV family)